MSEIGGAGDNERLSYLLNVAIALLLGVAAVATAWSAYQSSLWGGKELQSFNLATVRTSEAAVKTDEASQAFTEGNQAFIQDQTLFLEYVKAVQSNNEELAAYLVESVISDELYAAIEWWESQPEETAPLTPLDESNPEYVNPSYETAFALDDEARDLLVQAAEANSAAGKAGDKGDDYDLMTVLLASSLFLFGIAGVFREPPVKVGMTGLGLALLIVALVRIIGLDRA